MTRTEPLVKGGQKGKRTAAGKETAAEEAKKPVIPENGCISKKPLWQGLF